jgi:hypothetical protein
VKNIIVIILIIVLSFSCSQNQKTTVETIDIGSRWELFVDHYLISEMKNAALKLHRPERREIVLQGETEWEDNTMSFVRVLQDGDKVRLYYRASMQDQGEKRVPVYALAESFDGGITFTRPIFNLVDYNGSKQNNILKIAEIPTVPPPFIDTNPDCKPEQRYKGLSGEWKMCFAMCSPDGIYWELMSKDTLKMDGTFDTVNTSFWDPRIQAYRCFTRYFEDLKDDADVLGKDNINIRAIQSSTSKDYLNWTPVTHNQYKDNYPFQMYTNATIPCPGAEHIYVAFPNRYVQHRIVKSDHPYPGMNDALFMSSRDCINWNRFPEAWIRPGLDTLNWTDRNNYPAWGILETSETEWSMYVSEHYRHPVERPRLRRLSIRPRGFVSVNAGYDGGEIVTKPFVFKGSKLKINFSTSAIGAIKIELQDELGAPISGYSMADMDPIFGDSLERIVEWKGKTDVSQLIGKPIRMRCVLKDADLFAIQFVE